MASLPVVLRPAAGHEGDGSNSTGGGDGSGGFVNPSSFLRPRGQSQPMPKQERESAVDRDQRVGLVSVSYVVIMDTAALASMPLLIRSDFRARQRGQRVGMEGNIPARICHGFSVSL